MCELMHSFYTYICIEKGGAEGLQHGRIRGAGTNILYVALSFRQPNGSLSPLFFSIFLGSMPHTLLNLSFCNVPSSPTLWLLICTDLSYIMHDI